MALVATLQGAVGGVRETQKLVRGTASKRAPQMTLSAGVGVGRLLEAAGLPLKMQLLTLKRGVALFLSPQRSEAL